MELLSLLKRVEHRGAIETTHRVQQNCGQVFRYAVATGRAESDPSRDLRGALTPWKTAPLAAVFCDVQDGIEHLQIRQADVAALAWQAVLDLCKLRWGDLH